MSKVTGISLQEFREAAGLDPKPYGGLRVPERRHKQLLEGTDALGRGQVVSLFSDDLETIGKLWNNNFWVPGRNLVITDSNPGWGFSEFSILPFMPKQYAYIKRFDGVVVRPEWERTKEFIPHGDMTLDQVVAIIDRMKSAETLDQMVAREISWIESQFGVKVPAKVVSAIKKKINKATATRRYGAKKAKNAGTLYQFDGSKPKKLGTSAIGQQPWEHRGRSAAPLMEDGLLSRD